MASISKFDAELKLKGFKVNEIMSENCIVQTYNRKDFYKVCLVLGKSIIHYADKGIEIKDATLFFGNPYIPYSWEVITKEQVGFSCLFSEDFLNKNERFDSLQASPLFKIGGTPVFALNDEQKKVIISIFQKMIIEQNSEYFFKDDLIRNYINLIIHEALKMQPSGSVIKFRNASARIASLFLELLEKQFPIESIDHPLVLRTAQDFASNLSVHVNHLNRSVKEVTGKPTSVHISDRIIVEAKALLQYTDWNIADIAYALGFEYPTYFNIFFKKKEGRAPSALRK
jgi:AraC family transcriptional regulator, transcriptional activator of pobA